MNILINGRNEEVREGLPLPQLLDQLELSGKRIAVEVNEELVPRSAHADCVLQEGDRVEIVQAIGGG
jgi:sulfur carrier protein